MHFFALILKNVLRRPVRSVLTALGVALAVGTFVALVGLSNSFVGSISQRYATQGIDLVVLKSGRAEQIYATLPEKLGARIQALPNVAAVCPILFDVVTLEGSDLVGVFIQAWYAESPLFDHISIRSGRKFTANDHRVMLLGSILAENLGKGLGDTVTIDGQAFNVIGIYQAENAFENGGALVQISELQEIMDRHGQVTGFELILKDDSEAPTAATRHEIETMQDDSGKHLSLAATPVAAQVGSFIFIRMGKAMAWITSLIAVIIGCVGVLNTMMMSVFERTQEIGVLRAIGWRKSRIVRMIMLEALAVSVAGAIIGTVAALILSRLLTLIPSFAAAIDGHIAMITVVEGILVACLVGLLGSVYPAIRAARQTPVEALRHT